MVELKYKVEEKDNQISELHGIIDQHVKQINRYEQEIKDTKSANEKLLKELEHTTLKYEKMQLDYNSALYDATRTKTALQEKNQELKVTIIYLKKSELTLNSVYIFLM